MKYESRLRWDDVKYGPGELKVVAYKDGKKWAEDTVKTTGEPYGFEASVDRDEIFADGKDLALVIIRSKPGYSCSITVTAKSPGLKSARVSVKCKRKIKRSKK